MEVKINSIREAIKQGKYCFTIHAFERCIERNISPNEVKEAILNGDIIEYYPQDKYGPIIQRHGITIIRSGGRRDEMPSLW